MSPPHLARRPDAALSEPPTAPTRVLATELFDQSIESVTVCGLDGTCLYANAATERLTSLKLDELLGANVWERFPSARDTRLFEAFQSVARTGAPQSLVEHFAPWARTFAVQLYRTGDAVYLFIREITEEVRLNRALQLHARVLESMSEGVSVSDENGIIIYANPSENRMFGYEPGELVGKHVSIQNALSPEENARIVSAVIEELRTRGEWTGEFPNIRKDGTPFRTRARITTLSLAGKAHFVCVQQDVTEQRRIEAERARLLERAARLQEVTAALGRATTPAEVAQIIADTGVDLLSARFGGLSLLSADGTELVLAATRNVSDAARRHFQRVPMATKSAPVDAVRSLQPVFLESREEYERRYPQVPAVIHAEAGSRSAIPLLSHGRAIGVLGFGYDTWRPIPPEEREIQQQLANKCVQALERARLEEEQRSAERRAAFLAEVGRALMGSLDFEATLRQVAQLAVPAMADWCTVGALKEGGSLTRVAVVHRDPARQAAARELEQRYPPGAHRSGSYLSVFQTGRSVLVAQADDAALAAAAQDARHLELMRELGVASCLMVPLVSRGKVLGVISLMRSDRASRYGQADLALAEELASRAGLAVDNALLYREAQDAIQARDSFLSVASHELNTPLTSVKLNLQALERALRKLPEGAAATTAAAAEQKFSSVHRQLDRLGVLIRDLLDVSRITVGTMKLTPEELDLAAVVREVASRSADDAAKAGCLVRLDVPEQLLGQWDRLRVEQIAQNLLSNAIKYGRRSPVDVILRQEGHCAVLAVKDRGIGIAPEDHARIFERFERVVSERNYSGFGLGLWIVRQIVDAMDGSIEVESEPGNGATFTVSLPSATRIVA